MKILTTEEKLNRFLETSINDVRQQSTEIIAKYTSALETEFEEYKLLIDSQIEQQLKAESSKIRILTNRELAENQIEIKRNISKKQEELKDKLFAEIREKITAFKTTPAYHNLLIQQIKDAVKFAGADEIVIYIDPADKDLLGLLKDSTNVSILVSDTSFFGGIKAVIQSKNILINNSFKNKLEEVSDNFTFYGGSMNG